VMHQHDACINLMHRKHLNELLTMCIKTEQRIKVKG